MKVLILTLLIVGAVSSLPQREDKLKEQEEAIRQKLQGGETYQLTIIGGHVYFVSENPLLPWFDAAALCNSLGMKLLSLETPEKNVLINDHFSAMGLTGHYWASGQRISERWMWTSIGQVFTFFAWRPDEPDNFQADVGTGLTIDQGWYENDVGVPHRYVCE